MPQIHHLIIVKTTIFLTNLDNFKIVNEIYSSYFNNDTPQLVQL